jgi:Domain of unknown function DUF11
MNLMTLAALVGRGVSGLSANCSRKFSLRRSSLISTLSLVFLSSLLAASQAFAWQPGKDGAGNITGANTVVNTYYTVPGNLNSGATTVTLSSTAGLSVGDVLMIYQAQGATIDTSDSESYGSITSLNNAGNYEFVNVLSVAGSTVTISDFCGGGLLNNYTATGKIQVVRVPQYTTLTISGSGSIVATPWDGASGGIVAAFVQSTATIGGAGINVSGQGFRGGVIEQATSPVGANLVSSFRSTADTDGAEKGEGIAGSQADYDAQGRYGRGAPANGGGGGNGHNAAGGGGANGNNGLAYTGLGNPNASAQGTSDAAQTAAAWNLEGAGFATSTSSGGGRGGYSFSGSNADALTQGPGDAAWGGDQRDNVGGRGGRPLTNSPTGRRLFFGGGGGSGDRNNSASQNGANGAGLVFLSAASVGGAGTINADGGNALPTVPGHNDAPGGAGGGGSIVVVGTVSGVVLNARGGAGGNQLITNNEAEGPGGGGGGGFIAATGGSPDVAGGVNGTSTSAAVTEFIHNGATRGGAGNTASGPALSALPVCTLTGPAIASVSNGSAYEGGSIVQTVTLSAAPTAAATYPFTLAGNTATAGTDFTATAPTFSNGVTLSGGVLTVPAGVTTFTVTYPTLTDAVTDPNETTTLTVGGVSGTGTILENSAGTPIFTAGSCPTPTSFYQTRQGPGGTALLNFAAGVLTAGGSATNVYGTLNPIAVNAIGVRVTDGYIYGLEASGGVPQLVRLGQNGIEVVGNITGGGLPTTGFTPTGGVFDSLGRYYFAGQNGGTPNNITPSAIYRIDAIPSGAGPVTVSQVYNLSATTPNVGDIAFGPDGNLYGATGTGLYQFVLNAAASTATVNLRTVPAVGGIGSAFLNNDGQFFVYDNGAAELRQVTFSYGTAFATGAVNTGAPVSITAAAPVPASTTSSDGGNCTNFRADLAITKTNGTTAVVSGSTTVYTIRVTNNGPSLVSGAILSDPAVTGLNATAVACSATPGQCVTAPTVTQLQSGTFALPTLANGEFYEITVTVTVTATGI